MNKFSRSLTQCNVPGDRPDIFANLLDPKYLIFSIYLIPPLFIILRLHSSASPVNETLYIAKKIEIE